DLLSLAGPMETLILLTEEFQQAFTEAKRAENRLDFDDLERFTLTLLSSPGNHAASELRRQYRHVLVDEFQDINPLQAALPDSVLNPASIQNTGTLFVVGDVKQSIYGFRLAEPGLFIERERIARAAPRPSGTHSFLTLPHNFRSQSKLLETMNGIFSRMLTP